MSDPTNNHGCRDWHFLASSAQPAEREDITGEELDSASRAFVQTLRDCLDHELNVMVTDAKKAADIFWAINHEMRESGNANEQGFFGTRARLVNNTLSAVWYKNSFAPKAGQTKKTVFSQHLGKGNSPRYPVSTFKSARDWERDAIDVTEDRYALLRQRSKALSKIRAALSEYERLLDKCYRE